MSGSLGSASDPKAAISAGSSSTIPYLPGTAASTPTLLAEWVVGTGREEGWSEDLDEHVGPVNMSL